ncbi:MAG: phage minor capsid protein, partial [Ruminococcus sp.]|nr:phage minor capsid protein [Ruminococcus sp.]
MLSPSDYDRLCERITPIYDELDNAIIEDMARRIIRMGGVTESTKWQAKQLRESGMLYDDIISEILKRTDLTQNQVNSLFEYAGVQSVGNDNRRYRTAGLDGVVKMSDAALQTLNAGIEKCNGSLQNLTLTTANTSQSAYINACNQAYMQVVSGAFSYQEAIKQAIRKTAQSGAVVAYPSGHRDRIDVAVRRSVLTGIGQTVRKISMINASDMGCDLMEITAHAGARPEHARWQGKIVSLSGRRGYLSLNDIGYGTGEGFGGWNCRHDWFPFFEGISEPAYTPQQLGKLDEKNIEYNGKNYSEYEISQIQRRYEREIREARREQSAFRAAVEEADDPELKQVMQDSLNHANSLLRDR